MLAPWVSGRVSACAGGAAGVAAWVGEGVAAACGPELALNAAVMAAICASRDGTRSSRALIFAASDEPAGGTDCWAGGADCCAPARIDEPNISASISVEIFIP